MLVPVVHAAAGLTLRALARRVQRPRRARRLAPAHHRRPHGWDVHGRGGSERAHAVDDADHHPTRGGHPLDGRGAPACPSWPRDATIEIGRRLVLGLSFDHRVCEPVRRGELLGARRRAARRDGPRERALGAAPPPPGARLVRRGERPPTGSAAGRATTTSCCSSTRRPTRAACARSDEHFLVPRLGAGRRRGRRRSRRRRDLSRARSGRRVGDRERGRRPRRRQDARALASRTR